MEGEDRCADALNHTRQPMGEWLLREFQRIDALRTPERGDIINLG
jgi:hypothetical protein